MDKQSTTILRILGYFFILLAIFSISSPFLNKTSGNVFFTGYLILYSIIMLITAIGLFKMWHWARIAAIILLIAKIIQIVAGSIKDINTLLGDHLGREVVLIAFGGSVPILVIGFFIFYLLQPTIRNLFKSSLN